MGARTFLGIRMHGNTDVFQKAAAAAKRSNSANSPSPHRPTPARPASAQPVASVVLARGKPVVSVMLRWGFEGCSKEFRGCRLFSSNLCRLPQGQFMILTNPLQTQGLALSLDATPPAFQAWGHTPPSQQPRCTHGISPVYPRCISHVDGINMGDTPGIYRSNTVAIPWRHRSDTGPGVVSSLEGTQGANPS
jgi:hypothetical protein